ncbi:hypothetical protein L1987_09864 [Smallanthus sonchifolius]|uniref:Uncharacterized protein n=1 Tax=Smallanthus sonchifolius TaxID=185202 RepID=A0ACB9JQI6_9ASTR|nr:hypothetical protein L1987_09864 [Smallanthus sonchifolius]
MSSSSASSFQQYFSDDEADSLYSISLVPVPIASGDWSAPEPSHTSEEDPSVHYVPGESSYATSSGDLGSRLPSPTSVLPPSRVAPVTVVLHPATPSVGRSLFPGSTFEVGGSSTRTAPVIIELSSDEEEDPEDTRTNREVQMDELVEDYAGHETRLNHHHTVLEDVLERIPELYLYVTTLQASELNRNHRMDRFEKRVYSRLAIFMAFFVLLVAVVLGFYFRY